MDFHQRRRPLSNVSEFGEVELQRKANGRPINVHNRVFGEVGEEKTAFGICGDEGTNLVL